MKNNIAITAIITAGIVALVIHFTPRPQHKAAVTHGLPQAELFNMNGKCAELAEKLNETSGVHGDAISGEYKSHYNPRTNRCYVLFTTWKNFRFDPSGYKNYTPLPDDYMTESLYDAQTGGQLIYASRQRGPASASGHDWNVTTTPTNITFDEAEAKMERLMKEGEVEP
jgi:hypothetical protein